MPRDKQLGGIEFSDVLKKRQLDQALNAKEFAVMAGISYSMAREWFRSPGFPVIRGVVFWVDFVQWRRNQTGLDGSIKEDSSNELLPSEIPFSMSVKLPKKITQILSEAG